MGAWVVGLAGAFLLAAVPSYAQVASLGKGWLLDSAGSITSTASEVIAGGSSIKGSYSGSNSFTPFLYSDPTFVRFNPNQTYTISLSYRIITAGGGFEFGFFSASAGYVGPYVRTELVTGGAGSTGTATLKSTLFDFTDYQVGFKLPTTGTVVVDDIRISDGAGQLVAAENAEGPALVSGPLNFQLTDATARVYGGKTTLTNVAVHDLDGDGHPETIVTISNARTPDLVTPFEPIVIESSGRIRLATQDFFPAGAPTVKNSPMMLFADINGDGLPDVELAEAGFDFAPWTGSRIGVALNIGGGKYRDVSSLIPADQQTTRSEAIAVGDVLGDGRVEIVLPDAAGDGSNTALLRWNGNGFDEVRNWVPSSLWNSGPDSLCCPQNAMVLKDVDGDGRQDLLVGGSPGTPNLQILFGGGSGFAAPTRAALPDGPFGHTPFTPGPPPPVWSGAEVDPVIVADFNNDGLPDIFATEHLWSTYQPGVFSDTNDPAYANIRANGGSVRGEAAFQVLINDGSRRFVDASAGSSVQHLGRRTYFSLIPLDINNDGFLDVIGVYQTLLYARVKPQSGTTIFINDGTSAFQVVDGAQLLAATTTPSNGGRWSIGAFVPTVVTPRRTEAIVVDWVGGCGGPGFCAEEGLNAYKVVADGALGTGPNFIDPETLGAPAFNEFYYLRHYADAAAAVAAGQYKSGLEHYLAVGAAKGYRPHAVICASCAAPFGAIDTPGDHATGLSGSIAIGGWALSGSGITAVRILRAPVAGEGPQQVPVGTAVRLSGARPDVAAAYSTYLGKDKGGWGYLLLTNVLPNQGNGTYTLYVYADDADGRSTLIGTRTITANNAAATKPFGAIDTPGQGEIVSGTIVNFGWVLTPQPKTMPPDGSTITVYVDGVAVGHPTYNQYRADIATVFPGLHNSNGAVGAFVIDTTTLANGLHTISWFVTDDAGVSEGIGSRFFTVRNPR